MTSKEYRPDKVGLIISRREEERIYILKENSKPLIITLLEIDKDKARFGINAQEEYKVYREEVIKYNHPSILDQLRQGGIITREMLDSFLK